MHIEGVTFPVTEFYLEDLLEGRLRAAVAARDAAARAANRGDSSTFGGGASGGGSSSAVEDAALLAAAAAARVECMPYDAGLQGRPHQPGDTYTLHHMQRQKLLGYSVSR
jgi:hypothetical protein